MKKCTVFFSLLICFSIFISQDTATADKTDNKITAETTDKVDNEPLQPPKYIPDKGPTAHQKRIFKVEGMRDSNPGVYWYQLDSGKFRADSYRAEGGVVHTNNVGTPNDPYPGVATVVDKIEMRNNPLYEPHGFIDYTGTGINKKRITNQIITKVETIDDRQGQDSLITALDITDLKTAVMITSETGKIPNSNKYKEFKNEDTGNKAWSDNCGCYLDWTKHVFGYYTPINIYWRGDVVEQKKITLTGKKKLKVGEETNLTAAVATINEGQTEYGTPVNVSTGSTWSSDNKAVVDLVGSSGKIIAKKKGTAKVTAVWGQMVLLQLLL